MCSHRILLTVVITVVTVISGLAQPPDPSSDPDVPLGGTEILLAVGGLLGVKKIWDLQKHKYLK